MTLASLNPFNYSLSELKAAIIAGLYLIFAVVMLLFVVPPVGFEEAVIAIVGPTFALIGVFTATEHSPGDLQKALESLKATIMTAIGFFAAVPASTANNLEMLIGGIVMFVGVIWARKGVVSRDPPAIPVNSG